MTDKLDHYLNLWNLSNPQHLATTLTSTVYTVTFEDTIVVLKLLTDYGWEEKVGAIALRYFDGKGAVRLLQGDDVAQLLEYADGDDLFGMVRRGDDEQAAEIIGDVLNQLHSTPQKSPLEGLVPLKRWFKFLFDKADADRQAGIDSIFIRSASLAQKLLDDPQHVRVLHGDIHHENIRYREGRGWLAFDPKGLVGERTYDAANTLCNPRDTPELVNNEDRILKIAGILARKMGIEHQRVLSFLYMYACLSASWSLSAGESGRDAIIIAHLVEPHVLK